MTVPQINFLSVSNELTSDNMTTTVNEKTNPIDFKHWLTHEINTADNQIAQSNQQLQLLSAHGATNLHQVMISLEKAKLSFDLILQVRSRLLEAYQEIMRQQI